MELTKDDIQKLMYCIDLVIQNFGENDELEKIYEKLVEMKGQTTIYDFLDVSNSKF